MFTLNDFKNIDMKKKAVVIAIGIVVVVAIALAYSGWKDSDSNHAVTQKDETTGQATYTNLDYGFSIVYPQKDWDGPADTKEQSTIDKDPLHINAVFLSTSTAEAIVIVAKPGDTESFNQYATVLDSPYQVVTIGGMPALRYEFVTPINEEGTLYAKSVMVIFKQLKQGSITMAYQQVADTEAKAKAANVSRLDDFLSRIVFSEK